MRRCDGIAWVTGVGLVCLGLSASGAYPDADNDGDIDQFDLALFEACWSGPGGNAPEPECAVFDTVPDATITLADFADFQRLYNGDGAVSGTFPEDWIHGAPNCAQSTDPPLQVHQYNDDTFILRQDMCINFEGPFMYLLLGQERAILFDTGTSSNPNTVPIQSTVQGIIDQWKVDNGITGNYRLVVAHTHAHGDHVQGDPQFNGQPFTEVVGTSSAAVQAYYGFTNWPSEIVQFDLGNRTLDITGIPGHHSSHIAVYDRRTDMLITGDHLYPGFLFISNFSQYQDSCQRLADFVNANNVSYVMGTHIEMTSTPGVAYPYGTNYQPEERILQLLPEHIIELNDAVQAMGNRPVVEVHDDFIISPSGGFFSRPGWGGDSSGGEQ
jgi:glyoxylase-like metal-dependent hydrolase (beta-lactamase superfamily II)